MDPQERINDVYEVLYRLQLHGTDTLMNPVWDMQTGDNDKRTKAYLVFLKEINDLGIWEAEELLQAVYNLYLWDM